MHMYMYVRRRMYMSTRICMGARVCTYIYMYTNTCASICMYVCICTMYTCEHSYV